ncbi:MAG: class I SAM-dependent methyltransferase [Dissulfuribacterales bacterium]
MGNVFDFNDAVSYMRWLKADCNQHTIELESRLMTGMLHPFCGERLIDIGCGTGASLMPFLGKGILLTGADPSPYMLDVANKNLGHRVDLHRAYAEDLPFEDNSFDYASICLTLEFVEEPQKALEEAFRVAKDGVFIGILNKYALKALERRIKGIFKPSIYNHARFFGIGEIKYLIYKLLGDVPVSWKTTCQFPGIFHRFIYRIETLPLVQRSPFGAFAGIMVLPVPRFVAKPLTLKSAAAKAVSPNRRPVSCAEKKVEGINKV